MKSAFLCGCLALLLASGNRAGVPIENCTIAFATVGQARQAITHPDAFIQQLGRFDRSARMKVAREVGEKEFLEFLRENAESFRPAETNTIEQAVEGLRRKLSALNLKWPEKILLVKTTGKEEGNAGYTRGTTVFIPPGRVDKRGPAEVERFLIHELFHVLSRANPELRDELYASIGFKTCAALSYPKSWSWVTNPDAPVIRHYIRVSKGDHHYNVLPILLASPPAYDPARHDEFFIYVQPKLLTVQIEDGTGHPSFDAEKPNLMGQEEVSGFFEQIGRNTKYTLHPEEILADNFVLLANETKGVKSPLILEKMRAILSQYASRK